MKFSIARLALTCAVSVFAISCVSEKAATPKINLLSPDKLYSYVRGFGVNNDPDKVFQWEDGVLHVSGQHYGYMMTKEKYSNYVLYAEYKWGPRTWAPRENLARDSGVLVHCVGNDPKPTADWIWPQSLEAQIIEGGTGDILVVGGAKLTANGVTKGPKTERFDRPGRDPWKDEKGYRGEHELEKPVGQWNKLKVLCDGDIFGIWVNGHKTTVGTNASPRAGKILMQSEGAEIYFRRLEIQPLH